VKIYAALADVKARSQLFNEIRYPNLLSSFAYRNGLDVIEYQPEEVTLDSGAFTSWNSGKAVDIDEYRDWALENSIKYKNVRCINLDVIPGEAGRNSTKQERIDGMKKSIENADYLRSFGLNIMEVFHQDEPLEFLDLLLSRLPDKGVLCLSPRNDVSLKKKSEWQKGVLSHFVKKFEIEDLPRTHGLAVTSKKLITEFPYFSVDSSSYATPAMYGRVINHDGEQMSNKEFMGFDVRNTKEHQVPMNFLFQRMLEQNIKMAEMATTIWKNRGVVWE